MESSNRKKFRLKRANEMRRVEEFSKEELAEINKVKHIENDEKENNNNNNEELREKMDDVKIE
jgi:hypothetical protein